jgi:hypothetical protein
MFTHPSDQVIPRLLPRLAAVLAAVIGGLLASAAVVPAAFATVPAPGLDGRKDGSPLAPIPATTVHVVSGGMAGWQITLIALGAALVAAGAAVVLDRAWAARRAGPATTA